ncbi:OmpA family protein [Colwellia psychrerythraea]|uniref:OmpA/MotB domain protein n=1 Tax=Colwellia psychrerythraea TaxID=28229 RepID=A0A099L499_COLPS|nr:OmpA family protein [Colwellia psychrerythraea]KGJ97651.1 OmpA/MotB domain protein [Colwellia psychrerythraea]
MHSFHKYRLSTLSNILIPLMLSFNCIAHAVEDQEAKQNIENTVQQIQAALPSSYFYFGGKLGINHYQHGCESWSLDCDKDSFAPGLFAGYQFNDNFAFEAAYIDLGEAKATYLDSASEHLYKGTMKGLNLSAIGSIYLIEDVTLFGKAGVFNWYGENKGPYSTSKADDWAPSAGAGLSYQLNDSWQARFEYQYFHHLGNDTIGGTNAHFTSIGISYQLGRTRPTIVTKTVMKPAPIKLEEVTFPLLFDFDSSDLLLVDSLAVIVSRLTKYPQASVILRGYSDSKGSEKYNLALSQRRTDKIASYLIDKGVQEQQITSEYYGEKNPISDNLTEEHRHLNRHVQILLPSVFINTTQEQK